MSDEMMNTKEVARLPGHPREAGLRPDQDGADAGDAGHGEVDLSEEGDRCLDRGERQNGPGAGRQKSGRIAGALLASGSNDPVLDILQTCLRKAHPEFFIFSANTGSTGGADRTGKGLHRHRLVPPARPRNGEYNIPYLDKLVPSVKAVVVNLFFRELGFVIARGNPRGIRDFADLAREGVRFVNRQAGFGDPSASRSPPGEGRDFPLRGLPVTTEEVFTHIEVGLAVLSGEADTGIATAAVSSLLGLDFVPITRERFDMILDQSVFFQKGVQALMEVLTGEEFRKRVRNLGSYDFRSSGKIMYSTQ